MLRTARIIVPGYPHHVTQRGNNRQDVFFTDDDRRAYLDFLRDHCAAAGPPAEGEGQGTSTTIGGCPSF